MDRKIVYPGAIPLETDLLLTNKFAMMAVSKLAESLIGTATQYSGLAVTPTPVPSLAVQVGSGVIYMQAAADASAFSSLPADTTPILKQGLKLFANVLPVAAPTTSGYAINYLVQATMAEVDTDAVVLPYYNATNPNQAFAGAGNNGVSQATTRKCTCVVSLVAGAPAPTGSQTTPPPAAGNVGVAVVTVHAGDTAINSGSISAYAGTPILVGAGGAGQYAPLDSPAFTGTPTVPTAAGGDNSAKAASTAFVHNALAGLATESDIVTAIGAGFDASMATNGYQKLPGGLILQWGTYTGTTDTANIAFPMAFPGACFNVQVTAGSSSSTTMNNVKAYSITNAGFVIRAESNERPACWFAIGH